jgi:hypothetical protein
MNDDTSEPAMDAEGRRQEAAVAALRGLELSAPPRLVAAIEAEWAAAAPRRRRRRVRFGGLAAGLTVACFLALVLIGPLLTSGTDGGETVATVAAAAGLAERPPTHTSPPPDPVYPALFTLHSAGVPFPDFAAKFGWRATGWRDDTLGARAARTVFYVRGGHRVGYTILAGAPLPPPAGSKAVVREGTRLNISREGSRLVVTWLRDGRTCVLSATDVGGEELLTLASWTGKGTVPF